MTEQQRDPQSQNPTGGQKNYGGQQPSGTPQGKQNQKEVDVEDEDSSDIEGTEENETPTAQNNNEDTDSKKEQP